MKASKRGRLIREAIEAGWSERPTPTYFTVDIITGLPDGPDRVAFPILMGALRAEGRVVIDLARVGYRLTPL